MLSRWAGASHVAAEELLLEAEGREDGSLLADLEGAGPLVTGQTFTFCFKKMERVTRVS